MCARARGHTAHPSCTQFHTHIYTKHKNTYFLHTKVHTNTYNKISPTRGNYIWSHKANMNHLFNWVIFSALDPTCPNPTQNQIIKQVRTERVGKAPNSFGGKMEIIFKVLEFDVWRDGDELNSNYT